MKLFGRTIRFFKKPNPDEDLFFVTQSDQRRTVEELIEESKLSQSYYFLLFFASIITVSGLLVNNQLIIVAGMLIAPLLKPVLALSLGFVTMNSRLLTRSFLVLLVSCCIVIIVGLSVPLLYSPFFEGKLDPDIVDFHSMYFPIAVFSGMAASFAWTKKRQMAEVLTGTAIAVTLIPPLAVVGIALASYDTSLMRKSLFIFLYSCFTLIAGGALVFLLSGFRKEKHLTKEINKQLDKESKK